MVAAVEPHACDQVSCHQSVKKETRLKVCHLDYAHNFLPLRQDQAPQPLSQSYSLLTQRMSEQCNRDIRATMHAVWIC